MFLAVLASVGEQLNALRPSEAAVCLFFPVSAKHKCGPDEGVVPILQRALIPHGGGAGWLVGGCIFLFIYLRRPDTSNATCGLASRLTLSLR